MFETIVWATDGSEIASEALPALTELGLTHGATIVAVHVDQRFRGGSFEVGPQLADEEDAVTTITEQVADLCEAGLDASLLVETTDWLTTGSVVAEMSRELDADLIVVASRGVGAPANVMLGSVATGLLQEAHCPVLVVPAVLETITSGARQAVLVA